MRETSSLRALGALLFKVLFSVPALLINLVVFALTLHLCFPESDPLEDPLIYGWSWFNCAQGLTWVLKEYCLFLNLFRK